MFVSIVQAEQLVGDPIQFKQPIAHNEHWYVITKSMNWPWGQEVETQVVVAYIK